MNTYLNSLAINLLPAPVVLLTGGTGSFGQAFTDFLLANTRAHVRILSRDEHKQADMALRCPPGPRLTYILGDIRSLGKVEQAAEGCSHIVHAAALKTVPAGERYPDEFMATNVAGTHNVVRAALSARVPRTLFISSDKATAASNTYGKSKAAAESLVIQGNSLGVVAGSRFAVVRGGNVWGSRASVALVWRAALAAGAPIRVFGERATRFHMPMPFWTAFCWRVLGEMHGGEIFVPKVRAWALADLAAAFGGAVDLLPPRAGDKSHEQLVSSEEAARAVDVGWGWVVQPPEPFREIWNYEPWLGEPMSGAGAYSSDVAERMDPAELRALVAAL